MNTLKTLAGALAITLTLAGCQKTDLQKMAGSYTYKTSGTVGLIPEETADPDTLWMTLVPEQGQMNIVTKDSGQSLMIVTWNDLSGDACSTQATLAGNVLTLEPNTKNISVAQGLVKVGSGTVKYSGSGTLYDNMLIFALNYEGSLSVRDTAMRVVASKVECIAKAN